METAIVAALVSGGFSLVVVIVLILANMRLSRREIQSSEGIALRGVLAKQDSEWRREMELLRQQLEYCESERAADAAQRVADSVRHQADEEQRRKDDERHRADEARHVFDTAEILSTRQKLTRVQNDLDKLRHQLAAWASIPDSIPDTEVGDAIRDAESESGGPS